MIKNCHTRHENGNCLPAGGFCTANKNNCEALHNAYELGRESAQPEQLESKDVTFWKKRAKEYEEMVGELATEMARGVEFDSVLLTEEGIAFKKKKPEQRWIPCSETVDIPDHEIMACGRYGEFIIGYLDYKDEQWICESDDSLMYDPVAWCELPKPYKKGGAG